MSDFDPEYYAAMSYIEEYEPCTCYTGYDREVDVNIDRHYYEDLGKGRWEEPNNDCSYERIKDEAERDKHGCITGLDTR